MDFVLETLAQYGIELLVMVLTPVLLMLMNRVTKYLRDKVGLEVSKEQERKLEKLVREGISFAEEQAKKAANGKDHKLDEVTSEAKLKGAVKYIESHADEFGVEPLIKNKQSIVAEKVEALLFDSNI